MNCTKSVIDPFPSQVRVHCLCSHHIVPGWWQWPWRDLITPALSHSKPTHNGPFVHVTYIGCNSQHLLKSQQTCARAFSRNCRTLNRTTTSLRIHVVPDPGHTSSSCLPPCKLCTPNLDLLVAFHLLCSLSLWFHLNPLQLKCPSLAASAWWGFSSAFKTQSLPPGSLPWPRPPGWVKCSPQWSLVHSLAPCLQHCFIVHISLTPVIIIPCI